MQVWCTFVLIRFSSIGKTRVHWGNFSRSTRSCNTFYVCHVLLLVAEVWLQLGAKRKPGLRKGCLLPTPDSIWVRSLCCLLLATEAAETLARRRRILPPIF